MALGNLQEIIPAMFTGANGERLTPEQIAQRQQVAQSLLARASDTRPDAGGWASVLTKGLLGYQAGRDQRQSDEAIKTNAAASEANVGSMLGSLGLTGGNAFPSASAAVTPSTIGDMAMMSASPLQTTPLPEGQEWLQYANQGAIRNQPINEKLTSALSFLPELGVTMKVVSGGETAERKASNSGRHMHGNAADVDFYLGDRKLTPKNEQDRSILSQIVQRGKAAGITGWGEGDDYMGSGRVHLGFGNAGVWGAKGKGANAPEWLVNAYNSKPVMSSPQAAIQAIAPIEQGDENPAAGMAPVAQTDGAYVDPLVSVQPQPQQNNFDARFAGVQPVAEALMPLDTGTVSSIPQPQPAVDDRLGRLNDQIFGGALAENGVGNPVAQALAGYFPEAPSANRAPMQQAMPQQPQQAAPQMQSGGINPAIVQALSSPYASAQEKQIAGLLLGRQLDASDPMKQAEMQYKQAQIAQLNSGAPNANSAFGNLDAQARAAGLQPGTNDYKQFMLNGGGEPAAFRSLDMQAQAAGFQRGTPEYNQFMATRGAGLSAGAAQTAKNEADIATGGAAAGAVDLGKAAAKAGVDAWETYGKIQSNIANIDTAINAIDSGAQSGVVYNMLPSLSEASASLDNAMKRMGLDVIGSVTFGALSEGEMRLAMDTAVPQNLAPKELRSWLEKKKNAQAKAAATISDAAQYLTTPGNTINGWIQKNQQSKKSQTSQPPQPANPAIADQPAKISSKSEYDSLPIGTKFVAPDGSTRIKQ